MISERRRARRLSLRGLLPLVLVLLLTPFHALADASPNAMAKVPAYLARTTPGRLAVRQRQLEDFVSAVARTVPRTHHLRDPGLFCDRFHDFDMQRFTYSLWGELLAIPRRELLGQFARFVEACGFSPDAAKRAGFVIDYLYWNRLADTTGYEVAEVLEVRDAFYELYINRLVRDHLVTDTSVRAAGGPDPRTFRGDFLDASPMSRIRWFRAIGSALKAFSPNERRILGVMIDLVDFREGHLTPFGGELVRILASPDDLRVVSETHDYLQHVRAHPELLAERHGGWHRLMRVTRGRPEQAMRVFGVLAALLYIPLEDLAPALAARGQLDPSTAQALHDGSLSYYLMNELDERAAVPSARSAASLEYHFFYPDGFTTADWKWYHFYNNAHIGCVLRRAGYPDDAIAGAARLLAVLYEGTTLNLAIPARHRLGLDPRATPIVESSEDVQLNVAGARYGVAICR